MDIQDEKRLLRRKLLLIRSKVDAAERERASRDAAARVMELPEMATASTVMAFASFGTEISTDPLVESLLRSGRRVLMPVVEGTRLAAAPIRSPEDLAPGYRGIREPRRAAAGPAAADVILTPGVAFDPDGRRLGYGGGFYDTFLAEAAGLRAGFCFECQIVERVPAGPKDVPVDLIATEVRVLRASR